MVSQGCHRFRDTSVLDFSPFTSLAEYNSAAIQLSTPRNSLSGSSLPLSPNKVRHGLPNNTLQVLDLTSPWQRNGRTGSLRTDFAFPSSKVCLLSGWSQPVVAQMNGKFGHSMGKHGRDYKHSRTSSVSSQESTSSAYSLGSLGDHWRFKPQATSTEYRRSHTARSSRLQSEAWSEGLWSSQASEWPSPPPYSCRKALSSETASGDTSHEIWDHQELEDYSCLDLESETLSSRYTQCIDLPLEDYYHGKRIIYSFIRKLNSGKSSRESLTVDIPPGCQSQTIFCFSNVGHQIEDGTYQDIHLIFVERPHPLRFRRSGSDLVTHVRLPWSDRLNEEPMRFSITNVDGRRVSLEIDYRANKMVAGSAVFQEAGMPCLDGNRRGKLRIE
ncbi:hypothetical protein NMY22_g423 [Coprinellus aureogranulatus]|nr:hypothetical protein NMY22_g423 [Coprinellus aureogranulatus]